MAEYSDVLVFAELKEGRLASISAEMLGCGRKLADDLDQQLGVVLAGSGVAGIAKEAVAAGADKVYVVDDPLLADYQTDTYVAVMEKVVKEVMPRIILMGQTSIGRDLAARLAFRLGTALTKDCVGLVIEPNSKQLQCTKPVYGGNALAVLSSENYPQMATIRTKAMSPLEPDASRQGETLNITAGIDTSVIRAKLVKKVPEEISGIKLEDAEVVVSGGRGIGGAEGFQQLEGLAKLMNGAVGGSRPPCDNGWIQDRAQVGLTGKIIAPNLYIAVAISGASQHMAGCSGSKNMVAINKDPEASIFKYANLGIVGDWKKVLPAFSDKVKELLDS